MNFPLFKGRCLLLICVAACMLGGCVSVSTAPVKLTHHQVSDNPAGKLPRRMLVLPVDISVAEISAAGLVEEVPAWTAQAETLFAKALRRYAADARLGVVKMPALNDSQRDVVEEHMALAKLVWLTAMRTVGNPDMDEAFRPKRDHFDYSIGGGLRFLRKMAGANNALLLVGRDSRSSSGRVVASVFKALLLNPLRSGQSFLAVGVLDLRTGDLLWLNYGHSDLGSFIKDEDVHRMVRQVLGDYPAARLSQPAS